jgi:hypothetical protein
MNDNTALILQLMILASQQLAKWADLVNAARAAGRDVTDDELNAASADYKAAHDQLDKALGK